MALIAISKTTTVVVFNSEKSDFFPADLNDLEELIAKIKTDVPEEFQQHLDIDLDKNLDFGGDKKPLLKIEYSRPATAEELEERREQAKNRAALIEKHELLKLKELKAKYPDAA